MRLVIYKFVLFVCLFVCLAIEFSGVLGTDGKWIKFTNFFLDDCIIYKWFRVCLLRKLCCCRCLIQPVHLFGAGLLREMFLKNYWFTGALAVWTGFSLYLLINSNEYFQELVQLEMPPLNFRFVVIGFSVLQVSSSSPFPLSSVPC
jgi:hypothetical protein